MSKTPKKKPGRPKKSKITPGQIRGAKYLKNILELLRPLHDHCDCPNRKLHYDEYVAYLLLYFFTPVLDSMRGLHQASGFDVLKRKLKLGRFSLGSFSEAGSVFDPELLQPIIEKLAEEVSGIAQNPRFDSLGLDIVGVDGTLLHAMPKRVWALWLGERGNAAKMHLEYRLLKGAPTQAAVTHGNASEGLLLKQNGMTIVVYCALIASLLVVLWTGRKPTKRTYEMICFYFLGWVSDTELAAHIDKLQPADR